MGVGVCIAQALELPPDLVTNDFTLIELGMQPSVSST